MHASFSVIIHTPDSRKALYGSEEPKFIPVEQDNISCLMQEANTLLAEAETHYRENSSPSNRLDTAILYQRAIKLLWQAFNKSDEKTTEIFHKIQNSFFKTAACLFTIGEPLQQQPQVWKTLEGWARFSSANQMSSLKWGMGDFWDEFSPEQMIQIIVFLKKNEERSRPIKYSLDSSLVTYALKTDF